MFLPHYIFHNSHEKGKTLVVRSCLPGVIDPVSDPVPVTSVLTLTSLNGMKKEMPGCIEPILRGLFSQEAFEPVANKCTHDEDDHVDDDNDKNAKYSQETGTDTHTPGHNRRREEHKDNTQDEAGNRSIPEDAHEVFFPTVKKAKCYTDDEIQQFKPHANTPWYHQYLFFASK